MGDVTPSLAFMGVERALPVYWSLNLFNCNLSRKRITLDKSLRAGSRGTETQVRGFPTQLLPPWPQFPSWMPPLRVL